MRIQQQSNGGIEGRVAAMRGHAHDAVVQGNGCVALASFSTMRENQGHVVAKGGIEVLVAAMHGHPQHVQTQRNGGGALSNLSTQSCEGVHPVAIEKLESKIKRAETTNRSIIAAAYENISGYELIHKAILLILEIDNFEDLQLQLCRTVQQTLKVSHIHIMIEQEKPEDSVIKSNSYISVVKTGSVKNYINLENELLKKLILIHI